MLCVFLQGDYDQSRTKVLHMSLNPTSVARQRLREDHSQLQAECERLRGLLRAMERGGTVPTDLEAAAASLPSSKEVAGRHPPPPAPAIFDLLWVGPSACPWGSLWPSPACHPQRVSPPLWAARPGGCWSRALRPRVPMHLGGCANRWSRPSLQAAVEKQGAEVLGS